MAIFNFARRARKLRYYGDVIHSCYRKSAVEHDGGTWCLKCVKVYPPRDIRPFVMYCVNGKPRSSLLIESTDSMIIVESTDSMISRSRGGYKIFQGGGGAKLPDIMCRDLQYRR